MGLGDALSGSGLSLPSFSISGAGSIGVLILGIILFSGLVLVGTVFIAKRMMFNKKIVVFKKINGVTRPVDTDKGMFQKVGTAGDFWLLAKKFKKVLARPSNEISKNTFWFFIRDDGEWINFSLGDFDKQMKEAGANYSDNDMALSRVAIERNLRDRYMKKSFWDQYGQTIMNVIFMVVMLVCVVVVMTKTQKCLELANEITQLSLNGLNNIANKGVSLS